MTSGFSPKVFMSGAQQRLAAGGTPIFTYHKIGLAPKTTRDPFLYTTPAEFERQLDLLVENGFRVVSLGEISASSASKEKNCVLTFDDAFQNALKNGLKILARHKIPAIQFIVSG